MNAVHTKTGIQIPCAAIFGALELARSMPTLPRWKLGPVFTSDCSKYVSISNLGHVLNNFGTAHITPFRCRNLSNGTHLDRSQYGLIYVSTYSAFTLKIQSDKQLIIPLFVARNSLLACETLVCLVKLLSYIVRGARSSEDQNNH